MLIIKMEKTQVKTLTYIKKVITSTWFLKVCISLVAIKKYDIAHQKIIPQVYRNQLNMNGEYLWDLTRVTEEG